MARPSNPPSNDEDNEAAEQNAGIGFLKFNEPLSWSRGKPINLATLLQRLKDLSAELRELDQPEDNHRSLATPAKELVQADLLDHKDEGVRAYTAACLADMLRLHAPNAPYTEQQLKEIFKLFVACLKGLDKTDGVYYQQYLYLLDSLSTVKSVVLVSDISQSDAIIKDLFKTFFDIAKPEGSKNVEYQMTDILIQLIDECNSLPSAVIDIIAAQFLRMVPAQVPALKKTARGDNSHEKQTTLTSAVPPPAYTMAKSICNNCVDKMSRHICQFFSEAIMNNTPTSGDGADGDSEIHAIRETAENLGELRKAHRIAGELWKACPGVLNNVIPLLEHELLGDNGEVRKLACETIGEMALTGNFLSAAPATWKVWVGRANDKSPGVRAKWVQAAVKILKERNDTMAVQLVDLIAIKLNDLDDTVRFAVCEALRSLDYMTITTKLAADQSPFNLYDSTNSVAAGAAVNRKARPDTDTKNWGKKILQTLAERVRDKKIHVRLEGMRCLARMWDMAYKDIASGNDIVFAQLGWIPSKILDTFYINDPEVNVLLDHVLHEILIPVNYPPIEKEIDGTDDNANGKTKGKDKDDSKEREKEALEGDKIRVQRLLVLVKGLDAKAKRALFAVPLRQISYAKVMEVFLKACEDNNGGVIEQGIDEAAVKTTLDKFSAWLSQKLPEPPKAKDNLQKFAKLHDRKSYTAIRSCFNPDSDYRTVVHSLRRIKKRIGESSQPGILDSLTPLLYRVSQLIYNKSHVAPIVEFSRTDELSLASTAHEVLKEMSGSNPAVFKANIKALCDLLYDQSPSNGDTASAVDTLKACAGFVKSYPKDMPQERRLLQALVSFALTGDPAASKHAVTILMYSANRKELYANDLVKSCIKNFKYGEPNFLAKLSCLSQLSLLSPEQCEDDKDSIRTLVMDIIAQVRTPAPEDESEDDAKNAWLDDHELDDEIKAKLLALKVLVNRLRGHVDSANVENQGVIRSLNKIIQNDGETLKSKSTPATHRTRLRLAAAQHLLKLATYKPYDDLISAVEFNRLAVVAQDGCLQVRQGFINKLKKYLAAGKLNSRYYTPIFLMAYEPNEAWREETVTWIKARSLQIAKGTNGNLVTSGNLMEQVFARLMSLLVHHPDFGTQVEDATDFAKYILFYLRAIANEENIGLIHYVAQRAKQFKDKLSPDNSDNMYYLSELSQAVIRHYAEHHRWSIQTWPGRFRLPAALFAPMSTAAESQEVSKRTFLPEGVDKKLGALVRTSKSLGHGATTSSAPSTRKRKSDVNRDSSPPASVKKPRAEKPEKTKRTKKVTKVKAKKAQEAKEPVKEGDRRRSGRVSLAKQITYAEENGSDEYDDDSEDEEMGDVSESEDEPAPAPTPKSRGKPARNSIAASAKKPASKKASVDVVEMEIDTPEPEKEAEAEAGEDEEEEAESSATPPPAKSPVKQLPVGRRSARSNAAAKSKTPEKTTAKVAAKPAATRKSSRGMKAAERADSSDLSDVPDDV
ncbi:armadillo-type protein [Pyronema omphalodes]|nr:armadillo-type protein [Pyronema omphalodes]